MASTKTGEAISRTQIEGAATEEGGGDDRSGNNRAITSQDTACAASSTQTKRKFTEESEAEPHVKKTSFSILSGKAKATSPGSASQTLKPSRFGVSMSFGTKHKVLVDDSGGSPEPEVTGQSSTDKKAPAPIKLTLGTQKNKDPVPVKKSTSLAVAQAFQDEEDSDEDEMPPEARMRMRNRGRDTPTAAGPNSFGKNFLGFCDRRKILEKEMQKQLDSLDDKQ